MGLVVLFGCKNQKNNETTTKNGNSPAAAKPDSNQNKQSDSQVQGDKTMAIKVTSSAFSNEGMIPPKYTCDGEDISPPLAWDDIPAGTKSISLISDDPDAPVGTWVHWVMWNIPADKKGLAENVSPDESLADGSMQGITDFKRPGYGGPCPPSGTHRYYFKVYALDTNLELGKTTTKKDLLKAMEGHILAQGQLMGKYKRR